MRVGIDLVRASAVAEAIEAHGERYLQRVYTAGELADCGGLEAPDALRLAARFAAKEATLKVLRVGDDAVPWTTIEVHRAADGHPELRLHGRAAELATDAGLGVPVVSLTHEDEYAAAVVVSA